ncbi:MAG: retropepsin-like aspartic protease [Sedimenticolaceae bacterium]
MLTRLLKSRQNRALWYAVGLLAASGAAYPGSLDSPPYGNLAAQVEALAEQGGFSLVGLSRLEDVPARSVAGPPQQQLQVLLRGYNYVMTEQKLIVLGKKRWAPPIPKDTVLPTRRKGLHHVVDATVVGISEAELQVGLMIDTGASVSVLPLSMAAELGLLHDTMAEREVQTAKGKVQAKIGILTALRLGNQEITGVEVAFIEDAMLGGNRLLGMNVLGRYRIILDDQRNQLTLSPLE